MLSYYVISFITEIPGFSGWCSHYDIASDLEFTETINFFL